MSQIQVTDHALIRYLERIHGVSFDSTRTIIANQLEKPVSAFGGTGKFPLRSGGRAVMENNVVITVLP